MAGSIYSYIEWYGTVHFKFQTGSVENLSGHLRSADNPAISDKQSAFCSIIV